MWQDSMPEIAWGTFLLALGIALGYYFTISNALDGDLPYPLATLICTYLCFASFTIVHDAGHGGIIRLGSSLKPIQDILGWIYSVPLIITPYRFFQKIHDRHHAFTNDPGRDPDHFHLGGKWYQILLNMFYVPFQYHVMALTSLRNIKSFRDTYLSSIIYFSCLAISFGVLITMGYELELLSFVIMPLIITVFVIVLFFDYIPHHPHKSQDRYHNTRIFPGKLLNILLLGQNYHLIHHMYPRLPWYKYQEVYHKILPDLEAHGAPIEDVFGGIRPGFLKSPNAKNLQNGGKSINMLLKVSGIERSTIDSVTVRFALPEGEILRYQAGQYITLSKWLANEQQTRCYSLCAAPSEGLLEIGVRATPNGLVSSFLNHDLNVDDELIVQGPFGDFTYPPQHDHEIRDLVLIAGGSGITPILSILKTALREASSKKIHLIYASRSQNSTMFYDQINTLHLSNPERFKLTYVFKEGLPSANERIGKLDLAIIESILPMLRASSDSSHTEFYICGPEGLKNVATEVLGSKDIQTGRIHVEQFVSQLTAPIGLAHTIQISLADGQEHTLKVASNQTVLEVAKAEGVMIPHACGNGTCGTCKCKVRYGKVNQIPDTVPGITQYEKNAGYTLACQCKPLTSIALFEVQS
tara:strand:- start:3651 stop:5567 length:1917 start_codon:yes stop_codon:yes gene_type:complete